MKTALERLRERQENADCLRADLARLFDYAVRLRCFDPPKGDRAQALRYLSQQMEAFAVRCDIFGEDGQPTGYTDPADPWADEALIMLREDLADLSRPDAPYPLGPLTEDPFSMDPPRLYSGKMIKQACNLSLLGVSQ